VLLAAAVLSVWAGHTVDAVLIAIIVVANGIFGFVQDYRAEQSLESLRELASPTARVRRNGEVREVGATELVPGDIVVLRGGDVVPADGRLLEATDLEADEAALTGESVPVTKSAAPVESGAPSRSARAWSTRGPMSLEGRASWSSPGRGWRPKSAGSLGNSPRPRRRVRPCRTNSTSWVGPSDSACSVSALVAPLLLVRGTTAVQAALTAVSLAVAAIPEGCRPSSR